VIGETIVIARLQSLVTRGAWQSRGLTKNVELSRDESDWQDARQRLDEMV